MSQIATVELIYVAHSGRQYRARHKQVHTGWELEDLEQQAKSALSLRDYAIEFTNVNGHKQFIMPTDLETIIVNVVAITEERWEEPDYEALQQKWGQQLHNVYGDPDQKVEQAEHAVPDPERVRATGQALMKVNPVQPVTPDGETTQSIKITWGAQPTPPRQHVNWPRQNGKSASMDTEETQPIRVMKAAEVAGMSMDDATRIVERVAAGGTVTSAED